MDENKDILKRIKDYEVELLITQDGDVSYEERNIQRNKRFRRTAHEIDRFYKCVIQDCDKSYGSEGSLNQHYKLKHPEVYDALPNVQVQFLRTHSMCEIDPNIPQEAIEKL